LLQTVPNYIIAEPRKEDERTAAGVVKPVRKDRPGAKVLSIHPADSERLGVMVGDNVIFHAGNGGAADAEFNGHTYIMLHVDNVVGIITEDDGQVVLAH
jgi:co-chaperonin GroES (HSP10)